MKQVKFTRKYWKELIVEQVGTLHLRVMWNYAIYSKFIEICAQQEKLPVKIRIQLVFSKCVKPCLWSIAIGLEKLIKRLTRVTPYVDKIVDLVNPDGIPTRSLDTINKIKTVKNE